MGNRARLLRTVGVVGALLLAACGGSGEGDDAQVSTVDLQSALDATAAAPGYRMTQTVGQEMSGPMGTSADSSIDEDNPTVVGEFTAEGSHMRIDLSAILRPQLGDDAPEIAFEMWVGPDLMVIDTREYAAIQELNPAAELGPFAPGVSFVDLGQVESQGSDLLAAVVGQGIVDLSELAGRLPAALDDVEQTGDTFTGHGSFSDVLEAMGSDVEVTARSMAAGIALNVDADPEALASFYADYYDSLDAEVVVEVGGDGTLESLRYKVDLSGVFLGVIESGLFGTPSKAELREAREELADSVWIMESLVTFEVDDALELEPAPPTDDDRTDEWLDLLRSGGF